MMRRALFRLAATLPLAGPHDGLARPVNAPPGTRPAPGVQPGTTSPVINAVRVIVGGPPSKAGVFVYSGTPGKNTLLASETQGTTDPFGNTTIPGTTNYSTQGGTYYAIGLSQSGFPPRITWYVSGTDQTGTYSVMYGLYDASSAGVHGLSLQNVPYITPPGAWTAPLIPSDPAGANAGVAETWHKPTLAAGWTNNASLPIQYRLLVAGGVQWTGLATHAAYTANTPLLAAVIPAPYRPVNGAEQLPSQSPTSGGIAVSTGGVVNALTFDGGAGSTTACFPTGIYPIDTIT